MKKNMDVAVQEFGKLREGKECAEYEQVRLQIKVQRAQREREKCTDAINCLRAGAGKLQELIH